MFEHLASFPVVIVTGAQRSGTCVCADMIAHDLGYKLIKGRDYGFASKHYLLEKAARIAKSVIQSPYGFHHLPKLNRPYRAFVFVHRPLDEIKASRERMYAPAGDHPLMVGGPDPEPIIRALAREGLCKPDDDRDVAEIFEDVWEHLKRHEYILHPFDVTYHSLMSHPLWVPADTRRGLGSEWFVTRTRI